MEKKRINHKWILKVILFVMLVISGFLGFQVYRNHMAEIERVAEFRRNQEEVFNRLVYGHQMIFDHNFPQPFEQRDDSTIFADALWRFGRGDMKISEVVFVHSAEEAEGFPTNVLVAWPTEWSYLFLDYLNEWLDPEAIGWNQPEDLVLDISDFGVELPLTREFIVEDWEMMREIRERLSSSRDVPFVGGVSGMLANRVRAIIREARDDIEIESLEEDPSVFEEIDQD